MLSAYSQIPLPEELQLYTMFRLGEELYCFNTLPFGLAISSHVFTMYFALHLQIAKAKFLATLVPECVKKEERDKQEALADRISYYLTDQDETKRRIALRQLKVTRPKEGQSLRVANKWTENQGLPKAVREEL
jgi:hypothetical protein